MSTKQIKYNQNTQIRKHNTLSQFCMSECKTIYIFRTIWYNDNSIEYGQAIILILYHVGVDDQQQRLLLLDAGILNFCNSPFFGKKYCTL